MKKILPILFGTVLALSPAFVSAQTYCPEGDSDCTGSQVCESGVCVNPGSGSGTSNPSAGGLNTSLLEAWGDDIVFFINVVLVPLLMAVAFVVFLWGVFNYFIWNADSEDKRKEGKYFVMYGIVGFVIIISLWGLVNVGVDLLNLDTGSRPSTLPYPKL
ncbi:MAG: pilin [bacterium]|nr:pilin [bacterium]